ncbi:hypothetical protein Aph01nite_31770 [Acrocarpospora phusangensis]|uniref:Secreted protein n=1 Tax=Acrocarpospora phusangensis TaxID=1070424 RepID=A0A919QEM9_9ACTN|nr:hypothetical protein [Acrocarpospora phusangensis]GIH24867.1 hypothetical protein Aph01nite_31770 [Acrocarpospora phusangensis]
MRALVIAGVAAAALAGVLASPANAADTWHWGPAYSADGKAKVTSGKIVTRPGGLRVTGRLHDGSSSGACSWVRFRYLTDQGKTMHKSYKTCTAGYRKITLNTGHVLSIEAKVCRGTAAKITGKCSAYEGVWAQGG